VVGPRELPSEPSVRTVASNLTFGGRVMRDYLPLKDHAMRTGRGGGGNQMHISRLGRIVRRTASVAMASAAVFATVLATAPSGEAHGGVSIGIGIGFPGFIGVPFYAPPVYYAPPPVYYNAPYVASGPPRPVYRRHYHHVRQYRYCCCCY